MRPKKPLYLILCLLLTAGFVGAFTGDVQAQTPVKTAPAPAVMGKPTEQKTEDQAMAGFYAKHVAISMCGNEYRDQFMRELPLKPQEKTQFGAHISTACECLYKNMEGKLTPVQIVDYVMFTQGRNENPSKPPPEYMRYIASSEFSIGSRAYQDENARKKCGFVK